MGFKKSRRVLRLVLQMDEGDEPENVLMITVYAMRLGEVKDFTQGYPSSEDKWARVNYEQEEFIRRVSEWNLEDDEGNVAPISVESLDKFLDPTDIKLILQTWLARCMGTEVDAPLGRESSDGETMDHTPNMEALIPMEISSETSRES
jgi:hypothetical protein